MLLGLMLLSLMLGLMLLGLMWFGLIVLGLVSLGLIASAGAWQRAGLPPRRHWPKRRYDGRRDATH